MPLFQKRTVRPIRAEQFRVDQPLPFRDQGPIVCKDHQGWYVMSASGRQPVEDGDWIVREPASAGLPHGAYPIKPHIFADLYEQIGD